MKKSACISLLTAAIVICSVTARAESLMYAPAYHATTVEAGGSVNIPLVVLIQNLGNDCTLHFVDEVKAGNLPASWIKAGPEKVNVKANSPAAQGTLTVSVPSGTPPGKYFGFVLSAAEGVEGGADSGRGAFIQLEVLPAGHASTTGER